jgi:tetratricopeptide (TPR) repeat protein
VPCHHGVRAGSHNDRNRLIAKLDLPPELMPPVNADARPDGPYSAAGSIVRALTWPIDLVRRHNVEIRAVAPELDVDITTETLFNLTPIAERTRIHSCFRTLRIAHGLTELIRDHLTRLGDGPHHLVIDNVDRADATDRELIAVLLRRIDPGLLTLVIGAGPDPLGEPLESALRNCGGQWRDDSAGVPAEDAARSAYEGLDVTEADAAHQRYFGSGFHSASIELGARGRALTGPGDERWWRFTWRMAVSLTLLGRPDEAEAVYDEARRVSDDPLVHRVAAYETAMLYARHHVPARQDHSRARAWINAAIAYAELLPDPQERAFYTVFYRNGLALVRMRLGDLDGALHLVDDGLARMAHDFPPERHRLDRCSLLSNRARLLAALNRPAAALTAYNALVDLDSDYAEYHFDLAGHLHAMGRDAEAIAEYDTAIRLGPPFPEMYYNRAVLRTSAGEPDGALRDLDEVLELEPGHLDARINRAGLRADLGDAAGARSDVRAGLELDPDNPLLICVLGQLEMADERPDAARAAFDSVISADPGQSAAWAGRAALKYELGDHLGAVTDLTEALATATPAVAPQTAALLFNRAIAHRAVGHRTDAVSDLTRALELVPDDPDAAKLLAEIHDAA